MNQAVTVMQAGALVYSLVQKVKSKSSSLVLTEKDFHFYRTHSCEERQKSAALIKKKYPNRVPIIVEPANARTPGVDKTKYLAPSEITMGKFIYELRKRIQLNPEEAVFVYAAHTGAMVLPSETLLQCSHKHRNDDGFLYLTYSLENVFGAQ
jgi:GABA(A) receptor-associated protein